MTQSVTDYCGLFIYHNNAVDLNKDGSTESYLDWYDFDARYFDPQLCRWHVHDPANQHPSPYQAMSNNPVSFVDPDGLFDRYHRDGPYWGRRGVDDPDGQGGRLLGEGLIIPESMIWEMQVTFREMANQMENQIASADNNWVAQLQLWNYVQERAEYKNNINKNAKAKDEAPAQGKQESKQKKYRIYRGTWGCWTKFMEPSFSDTDW